MSQEIASSLAPRFRIFLSHAGEDKETIARPLWRRLREHDLPVFFDEESFRLGEHCPEVMEYAMKTAPVGVFIMSPEFVAKEWPMRELLAFVRRYDHAKLHKQEPPLLISVFYRLSTQECRDPAIFDTYGTLFRRCGLFKRAWDDVIPLKDIKHALNMSATLWSIRNDIGATNSSKPSMASTRESLITIIQKNILEHLGIEISQWEHKNRSNNDNRSAQRDVYIPRSNVPPNPPRLTLQYGSPTTSEGRLKAAVLRRTGNRVVAVVASGQGGVGKTCALRGLVEDNEINLVFPGGILYVELGNDASILNVVQGIANIVDFTGGSNLANKIKTAKSVAEASEKASQWFGPRSCLFLVDDIWRLNGIDSDVLEDLGRMVNKSSRMVYTTRDRHFLTRANEVIQFKEQETLGELSRRMLMTHADFELNTVLSHKNKVAFEYFLKLCQGLPLGFGIIGSAVRLYSFDCLQKQDAWSEFHHVVSSQQENLMEVESERYGKLSKIVDLSLQVLEKRSGHRKFWYWFRALSVLQKQQSVPDRMLQKLWGLDRLQETRTVMESFANVSVVQLTRKESSLSVKLHDLILDIAARKAADEGETETFFQTVVRNYMTFSESKGSSDCVMPPATNSGALVMQRAFPSWCSHIPTGTRVLPKEEQCHARRVRVLDLRHLRTVFDHQASAQRGTVKHDVEARKTTQIGPSTGQQFNQTRSGGEHGEHRTSELGFAWWDTEDDGFIQNNICRLLRRGRYFDQLLWLLAQPHWIVKRLVEGGILSVEHDLDHGRAMCRDNSSPQANHREHLQMVARAARMSASFVDKNRCVEEAWFQLHGRLQWHAMQNDLTKDFVWRMEDCAPKPWLKASAGLLQQAGGSMLQIVSVSGIVFCIHEEHDVIWILSKDYDVLHVGRYEKSNEHYKRMKLEIPVCLGIDCAAFLRVQGTLCVAVAEGLVARGRRHSIYLCDANTGACEQVVAHNCAHHRELIDFVSSGTRLACCSRDYSVLLWDTLSGKAVAQPLKGHNDEVMCVAMSADGTRIVSGSRDRTVRVWDAQTRRAVGQPIKGHKTWVTSVSMSADGAHIVSGSRDGAVRVWDAQTGSAVRQPVESHKAWVRRVAVSADGSRIVSGSDDCTVRVWDANTGSAVAQPLEGHNDMVLCVEVSDDGTRIVSGSHDGTVRVWNAPKCSAASQSPVSHDRWVTCVAVSADGTRIVTGSDDGTVRVWDAKTGNALALPLKGHNDQVRCLALSADGARIVSGGQDRTVRVWAAQTGKAVGKPLKGHKEFVTSVALSANGTRIVSSSYDRTVRVWDAKTSSAVGQPLKGHTDEVGCVAVSADGSCVVSGSHDHTVRVWHPQTSNALGKPLKGHHDEVTCVAVSADGSRIVSGSRDGTVRLWDANTGTAMGQPLRGHNDLLICVSVSADGNYILSSDAKFSRLWKVSKEGSECVITSSDAAWVRSIEALGLSFSQCFWAPFSREICHFDEDGSKTVLGTCECYMHNINGGDVYFSKTFRSCRIVR